MLKKHIPTLATISFAASLLFTAGIAQASSLSIAGATPISFLALTDNPQLLLADIRVAF